MFFGHFERSEDVTFSFSSLQISLVNGNFTDFYEGDLSEKHKFLDYLGGGFENFHLEDLNENPDSEPF